MKSGIRIHIKTLYICHTALNCYDRYNIFEMNKMHRICEFERIMQTKVDHVTNGLMAVCLQRFRIAEKIVFTPHLSKKLLTVCLETQNNSFSRELSVKSKSYCITQNCKILFSIYTLIYTRNIFPFSGANIKKYIYFNRQKDSSSSPSHRPSNIAIPRFLY